MADFEGAASPDGLGGGHSFPTGPSEEQSFGDAEGDADSAFGGSPRSGSGSTATGASESYNMDSASQADDDGMITVRAHNKKTGEITVMRVRKGTPMKEVMSKYAQNKGVKAEKLSWKRRASVRDSVSVVGTIPGPTSPDDGRDCGYTDCGCTGYAV
ncbi:hypothetical protein M885DRAFT_541143 [Pelagophyceae sp. CCMP2097]|nr:hypothetical protein M885DRAFT_541143 [Pelagophyceae sp. CCMP2097]